MTDMKGYTDTDKYITSNGRSPVPFFIMTAGAMLAVPCNIAVSGLGSIILAAALCAAGLAGFLKNLRKAADSRLVYTAFMVLGTEIILNKLIMHFLRGSGSYTARQLNDISFRLGFAFLMTLGLSVLVLPFIGNRMKKRRCCLPVDAECTDVIRKALSRGYAYFPMWEYSVYGEIYRVSYPVISVGKAEKGDLREILVDPDDPLDVYNRSDGTLLCAVIFGLAIIGFAVVFTLHRFGIV